MVKVYLAAVAACHVGFGERTASQHPLVCRFMKGARRLLPVSRPLVPPWDLAVVLEGLKGPPFEPLVGADLKHVSLKTVLLLALALAKRLFPGDVRMILRPNRAFVPKVVGSCSPIDLVAFAASPGFAATCGPASALDSGFGRILGLIQGSFCSGHLCCGELVLASHFCPFLYAGRLRSVRGVRGFDVLIGWNGVLFPVGWWMLGKLVWQYGSNHIP
ncbi:hypothetical protein N1851_014446 [Merluccius polli]|uniref:Uncharacterized protein n=1 Tax=Merluccius polli TaxID=89951 RepID=A0AA47MTH2_MERPO|nr:hypothetical protein N1851_014446 [Merluccius polli]